MATSEEVTFGALKFRFRAVFAEMPFLLTVEAFILAACLYGIDIHGVRIFLFDPFRRSFLNETQKLFSSSGLPKVGLESV